IVDDGDWNWQLFNELLPPRFLDQIAGIEAPVPNSGEDELIWGPDPKGKFSISLAYDILSASHISADPSLWKLVWRWQGPNRVKQFLWLVVQNRLLTNVECMKRHMTNDDRYKHCN
ncbi:hypothetical protein LINPERPRIM_LOCUS25270, partial [Linum perenne]